MEVKREQYIHLEKVSLADGIACIIENLDQPVKAARISLGVNGLVTHVTSLRLRTFAVKGTKCYICATEATHFSLDVFSSGSHSQIPHMNLWGIRENGSELLFTHDHVIARCLEGANKIENSEPCCTDCNNKKSRSESAELARRHAMRK